MQKIKQIILAAITMVLVVAGANAQTTVVNDITSNTTWNLAGSPYILDGYIFVRDGATLTIDAGVVIRGLDDNAANNVLPGGTNLGAITQAGENVGALIISRTGNIDAQGTAANPIIFTAAKDDLTSTTDLTCDSIGLWGGLVVLGNATVSSPAANFDSTKGFVETQIEGVVTTVATEEFATYGGNDDNDDSGIISYVSVRHGGDVLTDGDEINGITLGAVGRGTQIDHIEVLANADDGVEWFGGTVDVKYSVVTCVVDDSYDYDEGFRGRGQFWITIGTGNRLGEHDGGRSPDNALPYCTPVIFNATYIGKAAPAGEQEVIVFRDAAGGNYKNTIFHQSEQGLEFEYRHDVFSTYFQFSQVTSNLPVGTIQNLDINNCTFSNINGATFFINELPNGFTGSTQQTVSISNANTVVSNLAAGNTGNNLVQANTLSGTFGTGFDLRPSSAPANFTTVPAGFYTSVNYSGAVDPNAATPGDWTNGWTATQSYGIIQ